MPRALSESLWCRPAGFGLSHPGLATHRRVPTPCASRGGQRARCSWEKASPAGALARGLAAAASACASAGVTRAGAGPTGHHLPVPRPGQVAIGVKAQALSRGMGERGGSGVVLTAIAQRPACM